MIVSFQIGTENSENVINTVKRNNGCPNKLSILHGLHICPGRRHCKNARNLDSDFLG